jgi:hypothetical protein
MLFALTINPIGLLLLLLIFCILIWAARALMGAFGIGDPIATVVQVLIVLIFLLYLWQALGGGGTGIRLG